jgi:hypothetical protein
MNQMHNQMVAIKMQMISPYGYSVSTISKLKKKTKKWWKKWVENHT